MIIRPYGIWNDGMTTPVPPPDEPDIYQSLAAALMEASRGIRLANERSFLALQHIDRAIELTANIPDSLRRARELSEQAWALREQARPLARQEDAESMAQAEGLRQQANAIMLRVESLHEQVSAAVQSSREPMRQGIEGLMAASEIHRVALERAATLMSATRQPPSNGDNPDSATA